LYETLREEDENTRVQKNNALHLIIIINY